VLRGDLADHPSNLSPVEWRKSYAEKSVTV
jgi:hypothetical protein